MPKITMKKKMILGRKTIKEIFEVPNSIRNTIEFQRDNVKAISSSILTRGVESIILVGSGTSYHAAVIGAYMLNSFGKILGIPVQASEFEDYVGNLIGPRHVMIAYSQSGESTDTLKALRWAKQKGALIIGITNTPGSTITMEAHHSIITVAGVEESVVATKTFQAQLTATVLLLIELARELKFLEAEKGDEIMKALEELPDIISQNLEIWNRKMRRCAMKIKTVDDIFVLGFGLGFALGLEAGLKLKEASLVHSETFSIAEFRHGPMSLVTKGVVIIFIVPGLSEKIQFSEKLMRELKEKKATIIAIVQKDKPVSKRVTDFQIDVPTTHTILTPLLQAVPLQLLAYNLALARRIDPDSPRYLTKVVRLS